jgi:hypothetical protein
MVLFLHALASYSSFVPREPPGRSKSSCRQRREGPSDMIVRLLIDKMGAALGQR